MAGRTVFLNGQFVPEREAKLSIFDSAMIQGDMAFESTRTFQGEPFELRSHLERLFGTLEILQIACGFALEELETLTQETLRRNRATESADVEWQIVHNVSSGPGELYRAAFAEPIKPTVCINCWPLIPQLARLALLYETGVRLVIPPQRVLPASFIDPRAKTRSRVHAKIAQIQAQAIEPNAWPLLLDGEGFLAEGPAWNIFLIRQGRLITPTTRNVLPGISRSITRELAGELGIPCEERDIAPREAQATEEMFCTATSFCVLPVQTLDGQKIGNDCPGPLTRQLMEAWRQRVGVDFISQAKQSAEDYPRWLEKEKQAHSPS